ncbi:hypothetical protein [Acinetobacter silvestris]|uniref:Uncharacterized protein n=1 Tax=Acinetobacter silvestris TaxID=1977882 RepID=A0A1Y3CMM2_9GAMM|nr:hypothetical protein [Acinetobacter silvestris]OTG66371.1 hypothetical protein B9T28_03675 [Acinetobacter silvestris]
MKKIILLGCLLISGITMASIDETKTNEIDVCEDIAALAKEVMQQRQDNVPLQTQEQIALEFEGESKDVYELIVEHAYDQPLFNTDLGKQQTIEQFRKHYFELCMSEDN